MDLNAIAETIQQDDKPLKDFWVNKYKKDAAKNWDVFYKLNSTNFFKDRHWTDREFAELTTGAKTLLEVGCGVGNFIFPLLDKNPALTIYACDFSARAIELVKSNSLYDGLRCKAFVADLASEDLAAFLEPASIDIVSMIFVLSAIPLEKQDAAVQNVAKLLKPDGLVIFRDYGLFDMAQYRFAKSKQSKLEANLYVRSDNTLAYFFEKDELKGLFQRNGFVAEQVEIINRQVINRAKELTMERVFVQARFRRG